MSEASVPFLFDGPDDATRTLVLAHGAGAPMDSPFLNIVAAGLAAAGLRVVRFVFPSMRARREGGSGRAPDREPVLRKAWHDALAALRAHDGRERAVAIGGKSLGGRMASLVADEVRPQALVC
ncbi:MAG TPA: alpha/beta family hydrolase, partial [Thermoanaerobaculia bacterium]